MVPDAGMFDLVSSFTAFLAAPDASAPQRCLRAQV